MTRDMQIIVAQYAAAYENSNPHADELDTVQKYKSCHSC